MQDRIRAEQERQRAEPLPKGSAEALSIAETGNRKEGAAFKQRLYISRVLWAVLLAALVWMWAPLNAQEAPKPNFRTDQTDPSNQFDPSSPKPAPVAEEEEAPEEPSCVVYAYDDSAIQSLEENTSVTRQLVDALVVRLASDEKTPIPAPTLPASASVTPEAVGKAWKTLLGPVKKTDKIGIKVSTGGGRYFSTRVGVVKAIIDGLKLAGVSSKQIVIWDRTLKDLREAGFDEKMGCAVQGIEPPKGWDPEGTFQAPVLGKLIWGDLLFISKPKGIDTTTDLNQLSSKSHLAKILTRDITKFINVPTLTDDSGCGIAGTLYSATVANMDNSRRFSTFGEGGASSIPDIYLDPRVGEKAVVHILDSLIAQYAGGISHDPNYAYTHNTIYGSVDPVALDRVGVDLLEKWRASAKLPPLGNSVSWLQLAEDAGIGYAASDHIKLEPARQ